MSLRTLTSEEEKIGFLKSNYGHSPELAKSLISQGRFDDFYASTSKQLNRSLERGIERPLGQLYNFTNPNAINKPTDAQTQSELSSRKSEVLRGLDETGKFLSKSLSYLDQSSIDRYNTSLQSASDLYKDPSILNTYKFLEGGSVNPTNDLVEKVTGQAGTDARLTPNAASSVDATANSLLEDIKAGRVTPSKDNAAWTQMYQNGQATESQKLAYTKWEDFLQSNPTFKPGASKTGGNATPTSNPSIVDFLDSTGMPSDYNTRAKLARENGILNYTGSSEQNTRLLGLLRGQMDAQKNPSNTPATGAKTPAPDNTSEIDILNKEINDSQTGEADVINNNGSSVDTSLSAKMIKKLYDAQTEPAKKEASLAETLAAKRKELGVGGLEDDLASVDSDLAKLDADFTSLMPEEENRRVSVRQINKRQSAEELQYNRQRRDLVAERTSIANELSSKYSVIETMINVTGQDIDNARANYQDQFNRNVQMINMIKGVEDSAKTDQERKIDNARSNLQIMTNLVKDGNVSYDELDAATKLSIKNLEITAGLPTGFTSFVSEQIKDPVVSLLTAYTDKNTGERIQPVMTKKDDGTWDIQNVVISGGTSPSSSNTSGGSGARTDRHNNPIAVAVTAGGTNQFTKALDDAGIDWGYGDKFPDNPSMVTIKINGDAFEASRAVLGNTNAIQGWYLNHTGKQILSQYGVSTGTQFKSLSIADQNAIISGIYKAEGGNGLLAPAKSSGGKSSSSDIKKVSDGVKSILTGKRPAATTSGDDVFDF